jgi:hypothetical protein
VSTISGSLPAPATATPGDPQTPTDNSPQGGTDSEPNPTEHTTESAGQSEPSPPAATSTPEPSAYTPPPDAEPVDGDCPYLTKDEVQADTGQRMGQARLRASAPHPVCEFLRADGDYLGTVRVLQFATDAEAVNAVDFYVPRDQSNPETKPAGWAGGSIAADTGSIFAVSKGGWAVVAQTNQSLTVYSRLLASHAIANLGI